MNTIVLWSKMDKNTDVSTRPLARPFNRTDHSFAYSGLLALLALSAALSLSFSPSLSFSHSFYQSSKVVT